MSFYCIYPSKYILRFIAKKNEYSHSLVAQLVKKTAMQETPVWFLGQERFPGEGIGYPFQCSWASMVLQMVKNPPAMWETWIRSLGWEDPLEKGTATHSSTLIWRILWTEELAGYSPWGFKESDMTEQLSLSCPPRNMVKNIHSSFIHNIQNLKTTKMPYDTGAIDWMLVSTQKLRVEALIPNVMVQEVGSSGGN